MKNHLKARLLMLTLGFGSLALAACNNPGVSSNTTSPQPTIGTSGSAPAVMTPSPAISPSPVPAAEASGVTFNETFAEPSLDPQTWTLFPQGGLVTSGKGLSLLVAGNAQTFPYLYTTQQIFPQSGPFYFEMHYTCLALGNNLVAFCLDYEPPASPKGAPLAPPFLVMDHNLTASFKTEAGTTAFTIPAAAQPDRGQGITAHRIRVECDANGVYRWIFDNTEYGRVTSTRRPLRFWIGPSQGVLPTNSSWPGFNIQSITAGVLTSPDPAMPATAPATSTPTPSPSAS